MIRRLHVALAIGLMLSLFAGSLSIAAQEGRHQDFETDEFQEVWERTDYPVQQMETTRTWIWGPGANTPLLDEEYADAEGGARQVQYTDKSRMEMPDNGGDPESPWFITQGLLATELMTGQLQLGDDTFEEHQPADIPVAGDPDDELGPTYALMGSLMAQEPREEDTLITEVLAADGTISDNPDLEVYGATDAYWVEETGHYVASPFWNFMTSTGTIYEDDEFVEGDVFQDAFYAVGFPTTPAYWAWVKVDDVEQNVLIQCFERRCLTYAPENPEGWEVEAGNIGQHYENWRYNIIDDEEPVDGTSIQLSPAEAENPFFGPEGIEQFESEIESSVILEIGEDEWDDIPEEQQDEILADNVEDFWMTALGQPEPNLHTVEASVNVNGQAVESGSVDVLIEVDDGEEVILDDEVAIDDGVATVTYDVSDYVDPGETGHNTISVSYQDEAEARATKTWVPFLEYDYEQEPTYLLMENYFNQSTGEATGDVNDVDDWHDVITTLLDQFGQPIEGENLEVSVSGANPEPSETTSYNPANIETVQRDPDPWDGETNADGQRAFSYVGDNAGEDEILIEVESDPDVLATRTKTWVEPDE